MVYSGQQGGATSSSPADRPAVSVSSRLSVTCYQPPWMAPTLASIHAHVKAACKAYPHGTAAGNTTIFHRAGHTLPITHPFRLAPWAGGCSTPNPMCQPPHPPPWRAAALPHPHPHPQRARLPRHCSGQGGTACAHKEWHITCVGHLCARQRCREHPTPCCRARTKQHRHSVLHSGGAAMPGNSLPGSHHTTAVCIGRWR